MLHQGKAARESVGTWDYLHNALKTKKYLLFWKKSCEAECWESCILPHVSDNWVIVKVRDKAPKMILKTGSGSYNGGTGTPGCTDCRFPMLSIQGRPANFALVSPVEGSGDSSKDSELPLKINAPVSYSSLECYCKFESFHSSHWSPSLQQPRSQTLAQRGNSSG